MTAMRRNFWLVAITENLKMFVLRWNAASLDVLELRSFQSVLKDVIKAGVTIFGYLDSVA